MDTKDPELPELILDRICLQLGEKQVLNDLSLEIGRGALCCLLGPSGCGKTSLLNTIAGFYSPLPGKILLNEKEITRTMLFFRI